MYSVFDTLVTVFSSHTVYPKKYAHSFVVLCFVVVMQSFIMNSHEVFIHIHQGCFAGTGAIIRLPQCQWSKPDGYGKISQCITTTKQSKNRVHISWDILYLSHWGRVTHICVVELGHHWFRQWLVACSALSHYLNQCWNIVNWTFRNKLQWNFNHVVCKMASILSRPQWVNHRMCFVCLKWFEKHCVFLRILDRGSFCFIDTMGPFY